MKGENKEKRREIKRKRGKKREIGEIKSRRRKKRIVYM